MTRWRWTRNVFRWIWVEWWVVWLGILIPAGTFLIVWLLCSRIESTIRITGMFLQLGGFVTVLYGLDGRWRSLKHLGFFGVLGDKFSRFPRRSTTIHVKGAGIGVSAIAGMTARGRLGVRENATIEQRVNVLEKNFDSLDREVDKLTQSTEQRHKEIESKLRDEISEREQGDQKLSESITQTLVQGVSVELLGVWFFMVGIVMATASPELTGL